MNPNPNPQLIGKVIDGRYEIIECIGEGGMGVVYRARQKSIDRTVAIKMLSAHLATDRNWVQRFYNEAKACSRLHHPNTIRMFDFGQSTDGQLFMAMEFLDGASLRQVVTDQAPMDPLRVIKIIVQMCASLSEAHNLGIIHRDIKADNVFLLDLAGSRDHVKLLDFGVAKLMMSEGLATQVGVVFGTPQYMSPEQGKGEPLTPRSDLYGVGILAYEMLTGHVPFTDPNPMSIIHMHMTSPVPPLSQSVPPAVRDLVMRALAKDQSQRFETAATMMEECQTVHTALSTGQQRASGPPPPQGGYGPPPAARQPADARFAANQKTMLAGEPGAPPIPNPAMASQGGGGGQGGGAPGGGPAAQKTVMFDSAGSQPAPPPFSPGSTANPGPPLMPGGPQPGAPRTMLLQESEGIVSVGAPVMHSATPMPGPTPRAGASLMFWIFCLVTGLGVGIGAYLLVLQLG